MPQQNEIRMFFYDGTNWKRVLSESATADNLRVAIYDGANLISSGQMNDDAVAATVRGLLSKAFLYGYNGTTWDRLRIDASTGNLRTGLFEGSDQAELDQLSSDGIAATRRGLNVLSMLHAYNGDTWDRYRQGWQATLKASGEETSSQSGADFPTYNAVGCIVMMDVTAVSGSTPTMTVRIQIKDDTASGYKNIIAFPEVTGVTTKSVFLHPAATGTQFDTVKSGALTKNIRYTSTIGGSTPSFTYSLDFHAIP